MPLDTPVEFLYVNQTEVFTPESILAAGVDDLISTNPYTGESGPARKGTVAATLNNVALLNKLLTKSDAPENQTKIDKISRSIITLLPSLRVIGVFDLFTPQEWLANDDQPGRILGVVLYFQHYPQEITSSIKERLIQIQNQTKIKVLAEAIAKII
ncbi:MAG: DUF7709 family protein [Janthinobacterium lividum]